MCSLIALSTFSSGMPLCIKNYLLFIQKSAQPVPNIYLPLGNNFYYFIGSNSTNPYNIFPI